MTSDINIWILEDDKGIRFIYEDILALRYKIKFLSSVQELSENLNGKRPDLLIADLRLPGESFLQYLAKFEGQGAPFNFMVVSIIDDIDVLRTCFRSGALDYLIKPFHSSELIVKVERCIGRIKNLANQSEAENNENPLKIDPLNLTVSREGEDVIYFTSKEIQILSALAEVKPYRLLKVEILEKVWPNMTVSDKSLNVHLSNMRPKLKKPQS